MSADQIVLIVIALIGGGGMVGGITALLKIRPEAGQISVSAAQGAVIVQTGVIENLQREMARLREQVEALEAANAELRADVDERDLRIEQLTAHVDRLQKRDDLRQ